MKSLSFSKGTLFPQQSYKINDLVYVANLMIVKEDKLTQQKPFKVGFSSEFTENCVPGYVRMPSAFEGSSNCK